MSCRTLATSLVFVLASQSLGHAGDVVINEINYEPADKTKREEFIELYNRSDEEVALAGWFFSDGIEYRFAEGAKIPARSFAVLVEDVDAFKANYSAETIFGPWEGTLSNSGESLVLRSASGAREDQVDYGLAFPWPTAAAGDGSSMELIHPDLDNDLGGNWRTSGLSDTPPAERRFLLERGQSTWRFRKATSEASNPIDAWRQLDFVEDGTWTTAETPIGFGDDDDATLLDDMRENYSGIYMRHTFNVANDEELPTALILGEYVDDGFICWINGVEVARQRMVPGEHTFDMTARTSNEARWRSAFVQNSGAVRVGENIIAVHVFNQSVRSNDFSADFELFTPGAEDFPDDFFGFPTPGSPNSVLSEGVPPAVRQVDHSPETPPADSPFVVSAKVSDPDGVASVRLRYQIVLPGAYLPSSLPIPHAQLLQNSAQALPKNPAFEAAENWTEVSMRDDGQTPDETAGDGIYAVEIPGQVNRTLVRYRIVSTDRLGKSIVVPYKDDPSLNFSAYIWNGVPGYEITRRTIRDDGVGYVYPPEQMTSLAVYSLITRSSDFRTAIAASSGLQIPQGNQARFKFNWTGTFYYDGRVYDHVPLPATRSKRGATKTHRKEPERDTGAFDSTKAIACVHGTDSEIDIRPNGRCSTPGACSETASMETGA